MGGIPPKPTALRILQGNPSRRPINAAEPKPETVTGKIPPPNELTGEALKIWDWMCVTLAKVGLLTICDLRILCRYCDLCVRWWAAKQFLDEHGETYEVVKPVRLYNKETKSWDTVDKPDKWLNYPQVKNYLAYSKELLRIEQELGLTPAARSRIQVEIFNKPAAADALADYLAGNDRKPLVA